MSTRHNVDVARKATWLSFLVLALAASYGCPRPDRQAPDDVSGFQATAGDAQVELVWSNPSDDDFEGVVILRREDDYPSDPEDGTVVYEGTGEGATDTSLTNGTLYYYTVFAYDEVPNYSSGAQAQALPTAPSAQAQVLQQFDLSEQEVEDANIPSSAGDTLKETLEEAEADYRNGDPCAAATHLEEYEDEAQDFRQASSDPEEGGEFEALFVLGRRLRHDMLLAEPGKVDCSGQERVGLEATEAVDDQHSDNTEYQATATFGEARLLTVRHEGEVFTQVEIPGCDGLTGTEPGAPAVPVFRRLIAVPEGAQVTAECDSETAETIHVNMLPMQLPAVDGALPPRARRPARPLRVRGQTLRPGRRPVRR